MSFRLKTILGIASIETLLLLALVFSSLHDLRQSNQQALQRHASSALALLVTTSSDAVLSTDVARLSQLVGNFMQNDGVVYVRISDQQHILASAGDIRSREAFGNSDQNLEMVNDGVFDTAAPIVVAGENYGRVELGLSAAWIQDVLYQARRKVVGLAILEVTLVALFSWLLGSYLTRQLADLERAANRVAQGDQSPKLPIKGRDELAQVAKAFNAMSQRIESTYHELEQALTEAYRRGEWLHAVVDSELDGLVAIDSKGTINLFNRAAERIFGYRAEEVVGSNISQLMPEPYRSQHDQYIANYLQTGIKRVIGSGREVQGRRKDGTVFPMDLSITELRSASEQGFIGLVRDITVRKRLDEQLRISENMKKTMLESSLDGIVTIDDRGRIFEFNQAACLIFGYERDEVLGENMHTLLMPERFRDAHRKGMARYLETGEPRILNKRLELSALNRQGEEFPIELSISPIHLGEQIFFTAFIRDITESKQAEEALRQGRIQAEQASQVKSHFVATMSHEIRTPLNAILGTHELLHETVLNDTQKNYLKLANDAGNTLLALINDILDFSKIEAGKLELENVVFNPFKLIDEVLQLVNVKAQEKHLHLHYHIASDVLPIVYGDPWRLRQVLLNLLTNAVKFTPNGSVGLHLNQQPAEEGHGVLLFEVLDTGIGIADEAQPLLFDAFTQADPSDTRKFGGSGLGLAISKRLVELWGGRIGVRSQHGEGSRFWFSFGAYANSAQIRLNDETTFSEQANTGLAKCAKILLVEDSPTNQTVLSAMLRNAGHSVDIAECGSAALAQVQQNEYHLILMDVSMPDMDGMETTRRLRRMGAALADVPIVAMTAHAVKGYREQCLAAGMDDYVTKPISRTRLLDLVEHWAQCPGSPIPGNEDDDGHVTYRAEPDLLDDSVLAQLADDAGLFDITPLLQIFIKELSMRSASVSAAAESQNLSCLGNEVHALKSTAATFGAKPLQALAVQIDLCCKQGDSSQAFLLAERLLPCMQATRAALIALCRG